LQQHYQDCLDEVGMGHMQAALQVSSNKDLTVVLLKTQCCFVECIVADVLTEPNFFIFRVQQSKKYAA
jgi:hypothetical protein